MSLRYQIFSKILLSSLFILMLGCTLTLLQARNAVNKEIDSSLDLATQLISLNFSEKNFNDISLKHWLTHFISLKQAHHLKISLQKNTGELIEFKTPNTIDKNLLPPVWFIQLVSNSYAEMTQHLINNNNESIVLTIRANSLDEVSEAWAESRVFFTALILMMLLNFFSVNIVFKRTFNAIKIIINRLKAIEQGDYTQKLPLFYTKEYNSIARAINHTTEVLNATQQTNRALMLHSLEIQEEERQKLAQELHDELGQSLTAIKIMAVALQNKKTSSEQISSTIIEVCDHLIIVVRSMMRHLHPIMLTELGLKATLEDLLANWLIKNPELAINLYCADSVNDLEKRITIQIFRVIQEGITNIIRHAHANQASIDLKLHDNCLQLSISDNGQGCLLNKHPQGFGLLSMKERISSLGGELHIYSQINQGFIINASIPLV